MKVAVFSSKPYDRHSLQSADSGGQHDWTWIEDRLDTISAPYAAGHRAVCAFVNDTLDRAVQEQLVQGGTEFIALRCAGFDKVDLEAAHALGLQVGRVPAYSPYAVAEHAVALLMSLNRKIPRAHLRIQSHNFALDGLLGFDLYGKTIGVIGTGKIGLRFIRIMLGFGCRVLCYDPYPSPELSELPVEMGELGEVLSRSDVVSLHCPLMPPTHHLMNAEAFAQMKRGAILLNTSRGGLIDTEAAIDALQSGQLGALGLDVYENEAALFFEDRSAEARSDETFARLIALPNVLVTGHQAFFTHEALDNIAQATLANLNGWERGGVCPNPVTAP